MSTSRRSPAATGPTACSSCRCRPPAARPRAPRRRRRARRARRRRGDGRAHRSSPTTSRAAASPRSTCVDLGHQRIAFIGDDPTTRSASPRAPSASAGYRAVLRRRRASSADPSSCATARTTATVAQRPGRASSSPLRRPPDRGLRLVRRAGHRRARGGRGRRACRVPEDLSVIGFDDIELSAYVGLTTVRQPLFESGLPRRRRLLARGARPGRRRSRCDATRRPPSSTARAGRAADHRPPAESRREARAGRRG